MNEFVHMKFTFLNLLIGILSSKIIYHCVLRNGSRLCPVSRIPVSVSRFPVSESPFIPLSTIAHHYHYHYHYHLLCLFLSADSNILGAIVWQLTLFLIRFLQWNEQVLLNS